MDHLIKNDYYYNRQFRSYVDGYAAEHGISIEDALMSAEVRRAWRHYTEL